MDKKFIEETERLAEVAKKSGKPVEIGATDVPAESLRKCPRCGGHLVALNDKCATCDLPIKLWR